MTLILCHAGHDFNVGHSLDIVLTTSLTHAALSHLSVPLPRIQMLSVARFTLLLLFYALLMVRHWWPVAVSCSTNRCLLFLSVHMMCCERSNVSLLGAGLPLVGTSV